MIIHQTVIADTESQFALASETTKQFHIIAGEFHTIGNDPYGNGFVIEESVTGQFHMVDGFTEYTATKWSDSVWIALHIMDGLGFEPLTACQVAALLGESE